MPRHHPHHHGHHCSRPKHRRSNRDRVLEAVDLLRLARKISSLEDLIGSLKEMGEAEMVEFVGEFMSGMGARSLDIDTVIAANRAHAVVAARDDHDELIESCNGRKIGLLFPLPPHVHESFINDPNLTLMVAPGHKLPPHLRRMSYISNPREISQRLDQFDVIVFEGFEEDDSSFFVEAGVAAILDVRIIPAATKLLVHLRPHQHDDDERFDLNGRPISYI
jgi:hypothetical protein